MKAIRIHEYGGPNVMKVEDVEPSQPGASQVLVRHEAIGVNFKDTWERSAGPADRLPFTPGVEAAGVVEAVGDAVETLKPGDRVVYVINDSGAYAQVNVVDAEKLIPLPDDISTSLAAAVAVNGMTAHYLLHEFRRVGPGVNVLIHAAAGGMGLILVQWAKRLGARVIGTVSTPEKERLARNAGADEVIRYTEVDFVTETRRVTDGQGADLVIDGVGKTTLPGSLEAVAIRGHVVVYGKASGTPDPIQPLSLIQRSRTLAGGDLFDFIHSANERQARAESVFSGLREAI